jgi:hypothetical protein
MSTDRITVKLKCLKCGGVPFVEEDNPTDNSIVKCKSCGHVFGSYRDVKAKATEVATAEARRLLKPQLDKLKNMFKR